MSISEFLTNILVQVYYFFIKFKQKNGGIMGNSATKAKNKYNKEHYSRIALDVKKETKELWQHEAERRNMSLNAFIQYAVGKCLEEKNDIQYATRTDVISTGGYPLVTPPMGGELS